MYVVKTGCQWRQLPEEYPPWITVYWYFCKWKRDGTLDAIKKTLHRLLRKKLEKKEGPSVGIIDSQSARMTAIGSEDKGIDGHKRVKGRKRQIVVDTLGYVMSVVVHAANIHDSEGGKQLLDRLYHEERWDYGGLTKLYADQGYRGILVELVNQCGWQLDIVERNKEDGFAVKPKRWIVERTFAWFDNFRRLARDYERLAESSEAMIKWVMVFLLAKRISRLT